MVRLKLFVFVLMCLLSTVPMAIADDNGFGNGDSTPASETNNPASPQPNDGGSGSSTNESQGNNGPQGPGNETSLPSIPCIGQVPQFVCDLLATVLCPSRGTGGGVLPVQANVGTTFIGVGQRFDPLTLSFAYYEGYRVLC